jgi:hypothetical protein
MFEDSLNGPSVKPVLAGLVRSGVEKNWEK